MADVGVKESEPAERYRQLSFNILSCAAPLIWIKLLPIFDQLTYFGTLQVVVWRMLRESAIFFTLLALIAIGMFRITFSTSADRCDEGFVQSLTGLDVSDRSGRDTTSQVVYALFEGLLGSPAFELFRGEEASKSSLSVPCCI